MKTTREDVLMTALKLFSQRGFEAVSTSMIASQLGITKGALYRHFKSKQDIFDAIISRMFELDSKQAEEGSVPVKAYDDDREEYETTAFADICDFVNEQYVFWTENEFAVLFRRMLAIEQFKTPEMNRLYQDVIASGPVKYSEDLFREMLKNGQLNEEARKTGARNMALQLFAPLYLSIALFDGGADSAGLKDDLKKTTSDFEKRYMK